MTRCNLKSGYRCKTRNGNWYVCITEGCTPDILVNHSGFEYLNDYAPALTNCVNHDLDIVEVWSPPLDLAKVFDEQEHCIQIWQRKEVA